MWGELQMQPMAHNRRSRGRYQVIANGARGWATWYRRDGRGIGAETGVGGRRMSMQAVLAFATRAPRWPPDAYAQQELAETGPPIGSLRIYTTADAQAAATLS